MKKQGGNCLKLGIVTTIFALFITACSTIEAPVVAGQQTQANSESAENASEVATIIFNEVDQSQNMPIAEIRGEAGTKIPVRVIFSASESTQRRLYITQNILGEGGMPFDDFNVVNTSFKKALKADGSIGLNGDSKREVDLTFELPVPHIDNGLVIYNLWTTKGKGDFRNPMQRIALGVGTITVKVGAGINPFAKVRQFEGIKLYAPDNFGRTESFFSLLNETVYKINQGPEFRAFWDFGYYYGTSGISKGEKASFASTNVYDSSFGYDVKGLKPKYGEDDMANETLNEMFFAFFRGLLCHDKYLLRF